MVSKTVIKTQCSENCNVIKKTEPDEGIESDGDDETSPNKNLRKNKTCACKKCMASRRPQSVTQIVTVIKITSKQAANQKPSNQTKPVNDNAKTLEESTRPTVEISDINVIKSIEVVDTTKPRVTIKGSTEKLNDISEEDADTSGIELVSSFEIDENTIVPLDNKPLVKEEDDTIAEREVIPRAETIDQDKPPGEQEKDIDLAELESQIVGVEVQSIFPTPIAEFNIPENPDDDIIGRKYVADLYEPDVGFEDDKILNIKKTTENETDLRPKSIQCQEQCQVNMSPKVDKDKIMNDENVKSEEKSCKTTCKAYSENKKQCIVQGEAVLKPSCVHKPKTIPEYESEKCKRNKCKAVSKKMPVTADGQYPFKSFPEKTTKGEEPIFEYERDAIPQRAENDMREEVYSVPLEQEAKHEVENEQDTTVADIKDTFKVKKDDLNQFFPQKLADSETIPVEYDTGTNAPQRSEQNIHEQVYSIPMEEEVRDEHDKEHFKNTLDKKYSIKDYPIEAVKGETIPKDNAINALEKTEHNIQDQPVQPETKNDMVDIQKMDPAEYINENNKSKMKDGVILGQVDNLPTSSNEGEGAGTDFNGAFPQKGVQENQPQPVEYKNNLNNSQRAERDNNEEVYTLAARSNDKLEPLVTKPDRPPVQRNAELPSKKIITAADEPEETDVQLDSTENTKSEPNPDNVNNETMPSPEQKENIDSPNENGEGNRDDLGDGNPSTPEEMEQYLNDLWNDFKNSKYAKKLVAAGILFTIGLKLAKECNFMPIPLQTYVPTRF